jgi:hypothetical protein
MVKETAAWVAEKFSRLKLSHDPANGIGTFEALEFVVLGFMENWSYGVP